MSAIDLVVLAVLLLSRPIEARLWRAGRLSGRTTALLMLARLPVMVLYASVRAGMPPALMVFLLVIVCLVTALTYGWMVGFLREQRQELAKAAQHKVRRSE